MNCAGFPSGGWWGSTPWMPFHGHRDVPQAVQQERAVAEETLHCSGFGKLPFSWKLQSCAYFYPTNKLTQVQEPNMTFWLCRNCFSRNKVTKSEDVCWQKYRTTWESFISRNCRFSCLRCCLFPPIFSSSQIVEQYRIFHSFPPAHSTLQSIQ